jgi:hypothetical protein
VLVTVLGQPFVIPIPAAPRMPLRLRG